MAAPVGFPATPDAYPTRDQLLQVLARARPPGGEGWRTLGELADMLECPEDDMRRLLGELEKDGLVEPKDHPTGEAMYRIVSDT